MKCSFTEAVDFSTDTSPHARYFLVFIPMDCVSLFHFPKVSNNSCSMPDSVLSLDRKDCYLSFNASTSFFKLH